MKTKSYYPSKQYNGYSKKPIKKYTSKQDIILVHRISVAGMSRQMAEEQLAKYASNLQQKHGSLNIKHYVIPIGDAAGDFASDIQLVYPSLPMLNYDFINAELLPFLTKPQQRKIKIFNLLNNL